MYYGYLKDKTAVLLDDFKNLLLIFSIKFT